MAKKNQYGPYTARPGKSGAPWLLYLVTGAGIAAVSAGLWYVLSPESLARVHGRFFGPELAVRSLTVDVDRRYAEIPAGGAISLHPRQNFRVEALHTNRWRNYDLNLSSPDFDIARVSGGVSATALDLMGEEAMEAAAPLRLEVREGTEIRAVFEIIPAYTAVDLAALGDAANDPARKADLYQKAFALDPASRPLRETLIDALVAAGRKAEAAVMLEEEAAEGGQPVLTRLLGLYTDINDNEKRISALGRLIDLARATGGEYAAYQIQLVAVYKDLKELDKAAAVYEDMFQSAADDEGKSRALYSLRALYRDLGTPEQEIAAIKRLLEFFPQGSGRAPALWTEIIALYETLADAEGQTASWLSLAGALPDGENKANAYKRAAWLLAQAGKYAEAAEAYQSAQALDPGDINVYLNLGRLAAAQGDRAAYRAHLQKALEAAEGRDDLRRELAGAFYDDGLMTEAEAEYDALLAKKPDDQDSRLRLIAILEGAEGREDRLREEYAKLMVTQADNRVAAYNLAVLNFRGEKWDEAIDALKKILELDAGDLDARGYLFSAYEKKGDRENMLAEALEIYRRDPTRSDYRELLINSYENAADWPRLQTVAEEFVKLNPKDVEAWRLISRTQARQNKPVDAAQSLYNAAEAVGNDPGLWLSAAEAMSVQNQLPQAKSAYQKILELDPADKRAAEGLLDISLRAVSQ